MSKLNVLQRIEDLPYAERLTIKSRGNAIKGDIFDRAPELCRQPFDNLLNQICHEASYAEFKFGEPNTGYALVAIQEKLGVIMDACDVQAIESSSDRAVIFLRNTEAGLHKISKIIDDLIAEIPEPGRKP